jgi:hypothetical protein
MVVFIVFLRSATRSALFAVFVTGMVQSII